MKIKTATLVFMIFLLLMAGSAFALEIIKHSSGSAEVTYDGKNETFPLQIGFGVETDFSNAKTPLPFSANPVSKELAIRGASSFEVTVPK
jgi:hypothetical protein